jgi:hypothetical protein
VLINSPQLERALELHINDGHGNALRHYSDLPWCKLFSRIHAIIACTAAITSVKTIAQARQGTRRFNLVGEASGQKMSAKH